MDKSFGVMFHHFWDDRHINCQGAYSEANLIRLIELLRDRYNLTGADEYLWNARRDSLKPDMVCLTFDDGLKCQYDVAYPVLKREGITAFWFIYTQPIVSDRLDRMELYHHFRFSKFNNIDEFYAAFFDFLKLSDEYVTHDIERIMDNFSDEDYRPECTFYTHEDRLYRYVRNIMGDDYHNVMNRMMRYYKYDFVRAKELWMNVEDIRNLSLDGNIIGMHSYSHSTSIHMLSEKEQLSEWKTNLSDIGGWSIGQDICTASYPCGNFNSTTIEIMKNLNIDMAFADSMEESRNIYGKYSIPRMDSTYYLKHLEGKDE